MRTTVTMDDDLVARLQQLAHERGTTFTEVVNATVRAGLHPWPGDRVPYRLATRAMHRRPDFSRFAGLSWTDPLRD